MLHQAWGELGWSAESRKQALRAAERLRRSRRWREYVCESFCDLGGLGLRRSAFSRGFTLMLRYRHARRAWFRRALATRGDSI